MAVFSTNFICSIRSVLNKSKLKRDDNSFSEQNDIRSVKVPILLNKNRNHRYILQVRVKFYNPDTLHVKDSECSQFSSK